MMKRNKHYLVLIMAAFALFTYSFACLDEAMVCINVKDSYYVVAEPDFYRIYAVLLAVSGVLYFVFHRMEIALYYPISLIHIYGTLAAFLLMVYFKYQGSLEYQPSHLHYPSELPVDYNSYLLKALLTLILLQFLFIINIFVSIIKKYRSRAA